MNSNCLFKAGMDLPCFNSLCRSLSLIHTTEPSRVGRLFNGTDAHLGEGCLPKVQLSWGKVGSGGVTKHLGWAVEVPVESMLFLTHTPGS